MTRALLALVVAAAAGCTDHDAEPAARREPVESVAVAAAAPPPQALALGARHACWVRPDRRAVCWGDDDRAQLGHPACGATCVLGTADVEGLWAAGDCACLRTRGDVVECWGDCPTLAPEARAALPGPETMVTPAHLPTLGLYPDCSLDLAGTVLCYPSSPDLPVPVEGFDGHVEEIDVAEAFACARQADGSVWCWSPIGAQAPGAAPRIAAQEVAAVQDAIELYGESQSVCALRASGDVVCLFPGDPVVLVRMPVRDVVDVAAGNATCALRRSGLVACWVMYVAEDPHDPPIEISPMPALGRFTSIVSTRAVCALDSLGRVACSEIPFRAEPPFSMEWVPGVRGAVELSLSYNWSGRPCVRSSAGAVDCWDSDAGVMRPVPGVVDAIDLEAGPSAYCALTAGREVRCWPDEGWQIAGAAQFVARAPADAEALVAIPGRMCVRRASGGRQCWPVYLPDEVRPSHVPVPVLSGVGVRRVALSEGLFCALTGEGRVGCRAGATRDLVPPRSPTPIADVGVGATGEIFQLTVSGEVWRGAAGGTSTRVQGIAGARALAVGPGRLACALLGDATVACWESGGDAAATPVAGVRDAERVAVGGSHACALLRSGVVQCWGRNDRGQLGRPPAPATMPAAPVDRLGGVRALAAGVDSTCAQVGEREVRCWGGREGEDAGYRPAAVEGLLVDPG